MKAERMDVFVNGTISNASQSVQSFEIGESRK